MAKNKHDSIRFFDWNSLGGTVLVTIVLVFLTIGAIQFPSLFFLDESFWFQVIIYSAPVTIIYAWHTLTIYMEFGGTITFRKLWTKKEYEWSDIESLHFDVTTSSHLYGLIKHENLYLVFQMQQAGKTKKFSYLLSKKNQHELVDMVKIARPDPAHWSMNQSALDHHNGAGLNALPNCCQDVLSFFRIKIHVSVDVFHTHFDRNY